MRYAFPLAVSLLLAACGGSSEQSGGSGGQTFDVAEQSADASAPGAPRPPGVGPTAAPGVAFNYTYAFRAPPLKIGPLQEEHAQACEKLGVQRCRITAMTYELRGEEDVQAQLAFKLDPALARRFGKEGIDAVVRAEGLLVRASITGEDVGTRIEQGRRTQAQIDEELARIEAQLARRGLGAAERAELQAQAQGLRQSRRSEEGAQTERREQLATTPMVFNYEAGETDRSFRAAIGRALEGFVESARLLAILLVYLLPWMLAALAIWAGLRWINRRFFAARNPAPAAEPIPEQ